MMTVQTEQRLLDLRSATRVLNKVFLSSENTRDRENYRWKRSGKMYSENLYAEHPNFQAERGGARYGRASGRALPASVGRHP